MLRLVIHGLNESQKHVGFSAVNFQSVDSQQSCFITPSDPYDLFNFCTPAILYSVCRRIITLMFPFLSDLHCFVRS